MHIHVSRQDLGLDYKRFLYPHLLTDAAVNIILLVCAGRYQMYLFAAGHLTIQEIDTALSESRRMAFFNSAEKSVSSNLCLSKHFTS